MRLSGCLAAAALLVALVSDSILNAQAIGTTADRISAHGYPVQSFAVQTNDSYILTIFRIPYSPKLRNENMPYKPAVLLQHGLFCSSDCWLLNGPENALAYMLADAGFDVWLGNFRGNTYSKKHATLLPSMLSFWEFSWHEMGVHDLPAMIDYIRHATGQSGVHYVGHSQGATTFMVLLSTITEYNDKIRTSHLLAPAGYMNNSKSPIMKIVAHALKHPSKLSRWFGVGEFLPSNEALQKFASKACADSSSLQAICGNALNMFGGWGSTHLNHSLLSEVFTLDPTGSSTFQVMHYFQEYFSGYFRQFDFGAARNSLQYGQKSPPDYKVENIQPKDPVQFYYSDNDFLVAVEDVHRLARRFDKNVRLHRIKYKDWNHLDFLWALEVKPVINTKVIQSMKEYERKYSL